MEFGFINLCNAVIMLVILVPNWIYAAKGGVDVKAEDPRLTMLEQLGRYASMALMILPVGVWKFGFPNVLAMLIYLAGNSVLLLTYLIAWGFFLRKKTNCRAMLLAVVPVCIFLLTGLCLHHWLLAGAGVLFGICHISITCRNRKPE